MHRGSEVSLSFFYEYETVKLLLAAEDFLTSMKPVLWTLCFVSVATWRGCGGKKNPTAGKSPLPERGKFPVLASG